MADVKVISNALPLPLSVLISERPTSSVLPLTMARKLGTSGGGPIDPVDPKPPLEYAPFMPSVAACFAVSNTTAYGIDRIVSVNNNGSLIANELFVRHTQPITVAQRFAVQVKHFVTLANCNYILTGLTYQIASSKRVSTRALILLSSEQRATVSASIGYSRCSKAHSATALHYQQCMTAPLQSTIYYATAKSANNAGQHLEQCARVKVSKAVQVPCRHYPIPEPPPIKPDNVCRVRPPSSQLPLRMARQRRGLLSSNLPLTMTCWHDDPPLSIPNLRSYIVHNVITATIGGIAVDLLSFNIKTDMDSYCWQGSIDITAKDYDKIKHKLDVPRGSEPMVVAVVNGKPLAFIAEEQQRSRKFAQKSYSLSGRSVTARLGADYATSQGGLIDQASYVSQIVAQQLNGLSISLLDWGINDWLVPASAYSVANKTPIAVIIDIAAAGGGFVTSDPSQATLSVKPRWPVAAWQLASATPDVIVPIDVMSDISDKRRTNPRYNTVLLNSASEGGEVYRQIQGRDASAPTQDHPLYTDRDAIVPAGTAILSDSGIHGDYTLRMRWADKYNVQLAKLGDIWQINDPEGAWRGVTTGVSVSIDQSNDAPTVWQTVIIDRYLDV